MTVNTRKRGETLTVMLDGALNRTTCDAVEAQITGEMQGIRKLVFDMEKLSFISSAGLRVLVKLRKQVGDRERAFFVSTAERLWAKEDGKEAEIDADSLYILLPSFCVSELTKAFQIGFLVYLPFIAIDIVVSNILLAMGMMMVSPVTISLPFKLLLFVMVDGWTLLIQGLVRSYV